MPLVPIGELLVHARRRHYAVGYFESWDIASLEGVIDAAEQSRSPVIIGFNGEFLARADRQPPVWLEWYGALARAAAESATVPCAALFNECPIDASVERAAEVGFNVVMLTDERAEYANLVPRVAKIVGLAHARGVAVEGELDALPANRIEHVGGSGSHTDPDRAAAFVRDTGVDLLSVSAGNVHILLEGQCELNLAHLQAVRDKVDLPLVLHGGSGISSDSLRRAIEIGIAKVNYGTYLKQRCLTKLATSPWFAGVGRALHAEPIASFQFGEAYQSTSAPNLNPHELLGDGGKNDLAVIVRRAVRDAVLERIGILGCRGKA